MKVHDWQKGIRLLRVESPEEGGPYRPGFVGAYQTIFAEPPYFERHYAEEAEAVLLRILQTPGQVTLLAVRGTCNVVGFGCGVPLDSRPDVSRHMHGLLPARHSFYLAELGVLPTWRGFGLGHELVRRRLEAIDSRRFTHVVLRTSTAPEGEHALFRSLGFEDMGVTMEVGARRLDGRVRTDRRLFLSKVIGS